MTSARRPEGRALLLATLLITLVVAAPAQEPGPGEPREIGLIEKATRRIAQLDVTVRGPESAIANLGPADFELAVDGRKIDEFTVDRVCAAPAARSAGAAATAPTAAPEATPAAAPAVPAVPPTTFLFYFDQHMLTMAGRQNAIDDARRMIPELVRGGARAALVSSGETLDTLADLTSDPASLLAALDRMEGDRRYWDMYPQLEESRIREVIDTYQQQGVEMSCSVARRYQLEEAYRTDRALRRFSMVLGVFAELDPPKAAIYFADTVRRDAGSHYYGYVGRCAVSSSNPSGSRGPSMFGAEFSVDAVIAEAAANGIRLYTVQAEGLVSPGTVAVPVLRPQSSPTANMARVRSAQDSLSTMALETGGRAFLNGVAAPKMAAEIRSDLECLYLISFDAHDLPLDRPLRVVLRSARPRVEASTRGQLVLQSDSARRTSRLLAAFAAPASVRSDVTLRGQIVPLGFEDGSYRAIVQLVAPGSPLPEARWDLGASLVSGGEIRHDDSGRVTVDRPGVPVVFESEMSFRPGPYELILVAHESTADQLGTLRLEGSWPDRTAGPAIGPIAVVQREPAVFLRGGHVRASGSLSRGEKELVRAERPTVLLSLVCRGASRDRLVVERSLDGEESTAFEPIEIEPGKEPCAQLRDVIPARTMSAGRFAYRIRVLEDGREVAGASREVYAVDETGTAEPSAVPH